LGVPDIITCPRVYNGYPTEKPPYVARVLIEQSSSEREVVADPFMGSGSTGVAALASRRNFLGNDLGNEALRISQENLARSAGKLDTDLYLTRTS
jgi:site-specific DNA-methyltransferase (adenine-specific)